MIIYMVTAPGHEGTGYGDALAVASTGEGLVSFLEYQDDGRPVTGFAMSGHDWDLAAMASAEDSEATC